MRVERFLAAMAIAVLGSVGCGGGTAGQPAAQSREAWDEIQARKTLRVAMTLQFPPQFYRDPQTKEPAGYDVEMLKMMAKDLGVELEIQDMDFTGQIPALLAGQVDMVANGLVNTPERAKSIQFTDPYVPYDLVLMVQKDLGVKSREELNRKGRVIAVLLGSVSERLAKLLFPDAEVRGLDRQEACMLEVSSKRSDGCLMERYLAIPYIRNNPQATQLLEGDKPLATQHGALAIRYGNPRLLYWVNNWLGYYKDNGVLDALYDRIIGPSLKP